MITFRPHHFLCTLGFKGAGYSPKFIANYKDIVQRLPEENIQVTGALDSICAACPHKTTRNTCAKQAFIDRLDHRHAEALELEEGDIFTWEEAKARIKEKVTIERFHTICEGCGWKKYGVCEEALMRLHSY